MTLARTAVAAATTFLLFLAATPAGAAPITWHLTGTGTNAGGTNWGNAWTFEAGNITVTATAWAYTYGDSNNALENAQLAKWSTGLGVCDRTEGKGCDSPQHQVDNVGADNFVLFYFSQNVDVDTIRIDPYGEWDRDVTYWAGNLANPDLTGATYASLFGTRDDDNSDRSENARNVPIDAGPQYVNAVLFGALIGEPDEKKYQDYFKISKIIGTPEPPRENPPVPEPASMLLVASGLAGLAARRFGRRPRS